MSNKKEELSDLFLKRIAEGKSIKYKNFREEDGSLLFKIEKVFGGISGCAEYCGITKEELISKYGMGRQIHKGMLSDEEILSRLLFLKSIGKLNTNNMRIQFGDLRLEYSLKKKHGSVNKALEFYNLKRDTKVVKLEELIKEVKSLEQSNYDLSYKNMMENHSALLSNICNKMNMGWYKSLTKLGINFTPIHSMAYTKESISVKLKDIIEIEGSISYSILREKYSGILNYVRANYGSIYEFYIDFGYEPMDYMDFTTQKAKGFMFESVFKEILDTLGYSYEFNKYINNNTLRPDFIMEDGSIIDCKLSSWTSTIAETFDKYKDFTHKVTVVYLRGKNEYSNISDDKFEIVNVKELPKEKEDYFIGKLEYILNNDNFIETVTTERTSA